MMTTIKKQTRLNRNLDRLLKYSDEKPELETYLGIMLPIIIAKIAEEQYDYSYSNKMATGLLDFISTLSKEDMDKISILCQKFKVIECIALIATEPLPQFFTVTDEERKIAVLECDNAPVVAEKYLIRLVLKRNGLGEDAELLSDLFFPNKWLPNSKLMVVYTPSIRTSEYRNNILSLFNKGIKK